MQVLERATAKKRLRLLTHHQKHLFSNYLLIQQQEIQEEKSSQMDKNIKASTLLNHLVKQEHKVHPGETKEGKIVEVCHDREVNVYTLRVHGLET